MKIGTAARSGQLAPLILGARACLIIFMATSVSVWFEYLLRFSHLVAGIAWIGSSFYFIWLDSSFETPLIQRRNVEGELFMVHGGFYYQVEKRKIYPGELPANLHWFKWEATLTWLTGLGLFFYLYYLNNAALLVSPTAGLAATTTILLSLAIIIVSWFVYDLIWHPKLKSRAISLVLTLFYFSGLIALNFQYFSSRGAFIQTGAVLGSLMLLNVWVRILPGQRRMVQSAERGETPDYTESAKSKIRSVHNTYFTFPVLFIMLSNHYPNIYSHKHNVALLVILSLSAALLRHAMVTKKKIERFTLLPSALGLLALVFLTVAPPTSSNSALGPVSFETVHAIFVERCQTCHSSKPTDDIFTVAPKGVIFETEEQIRALSEKIYMHVVTAQSMPLGNKTQMTETERAKIAAWLKPN